MASSSKSSRKTVAFDNSSQDQALIEAVETELADGDYRSFGELCKAALHQFLVNREPTQSVILFMELGKQIAALQSRSDQLEAENLASTVRIEKLEEQIATINKDLRPSSEETLENERELSNQPLDSAQQPEIDPLLARLTPLLESF